MRKMILAVALATSLSAPSLAADVTISTPGVAVDTPSVTINQSTPPVDLTPLTNRLDALEARPVPTPHTPPTDLTPLQSQVDTLQLRVDAIPAPTPHTPAFDPTALDAALAAAVSRIGTLEALVEELRNPGPGQQTMVPRTENELAIMAATTPFMVHAMVSDPLGVIPAEDWAALTPTELAAAVDEICRAPWSCLADLTGNPQYQGMSRVRGHIGQADRWWRGFGVLHGGVVLLPGTHDSKRLGRYANPSDPTRQIREWFFRNAPTMRGVGGDRAATVIDCRTGFAGGGNFCLETRQNFGVENADGTYDDSRTMFTFEGMTILGTTENSSNASIGATSGDDSRLAVVDVHLEGGANCIRTTGRVVVVGHSHLDGCSGGPGAHNIYGSSDWSRGVYNPILLMVDVVSTGPALAHGAKSKSAVNYFLGGEYESRSGLAVEVPSGGAALLEGLTLRKPVGRGDQWRVFAMGSEFIARGGVGWTTGEPDVANGRNESQLCRFMVRDMSVFQPDISAVPQGRVTLRDVHVQNFQGPNAVGNNGTLVWANPFTLSDGTPACRPPHEVINMTAEGGAVSLNGTVGTGYVQPDGTVVLDDPASTPLWVDLTAR